MRNSAQMAIPVVVPRALIVWALTRLVLAALPLAIGEPFGSMSPSPIPVVVLAGFIGLIDVHVRGERILWANLAVRPLVLYAIYAAAAIPAELLLAVALR
jgi:hypothetical protein